MKRKWTLVLCCAAFHLSHKYDVKHAIQAPMMIAWQPCKTFSTLKPNVIQRKREYR